MHMYVYIYIYIYTYPNATCLIRPHLSCVIFVASGIVVTCYITYSPRLKKTCVRQVVLDKWLPLIELSLNNH